MSLMNPLSGIFRRAFHFVSLVPIAAVVLIASRALATEDTQVASPDGTIHFRVTFKGGLGYAVNFKNETVIEPSRLVFSLDGKDLTSSPAVGEVKTYHIDETYPWRGVHSVASNHCNGATIALKSGGVSYSLEIRAFNDGVAYRFIAPGAAGQNRVPDEASTFRIPDGSRVWYHDLKGHYEGQHTNNLVAAVPAGQWVAPPMTFKLPNDRGYASVTEADLVNYSGMALQATAPFEFSVALAHKQPPSHPFLMRYGTNEAIRLSHAAAVTGTVTTPWRVVMIGADLNALVNCDILPDLCPPPNPKIFPQGLKTDWIKPGRAVWKYLDGGDSSLEGTKDFCRMAGELGFEYNVVEGYWSRWSDAEIKDLAAYAKQNGVRLLFWKHSRSLRTPEAREEFFKKLRDLGVAGAKIDFFDNEHKEIIDLYEALLQDAAKYHLVVIFHGSDKPTGRIRTWPNEITREAVRGMESSRLRNRATHETTLPFTRMLAGPADYSVVDFGERRQNTTWAHQIATAAIFSQPMLTYAANPSNLLANAGVDLIKSIPPDWDETIVLPPSEIGKLAIYARRSGDTWFLAVIGGRDAQTIQVPLSFLGPEAYESMFIRDSANGPDAEEVEHRAARREDTLTINLRPGGGFIGRFTRK
ncbi:MAG TPA: glycoside hydrolase family 97 catalytic domain-containing protein [Verrucomicrobiae bacterium]|nr:glycoside hydrolase family 97 catalytic domain-containing protein [Verrucomicrobiae bacterium]